jgi:hypothetical protein
MSGPEGKKPEGDLPGKKNDPDGTESGEKTLFDEAVGGASDDKFAADNNLLQRSSTPKSVHDVAGVSEDERELLNQLRMMKIKPGTLQKTLQNIPQVQYLSSDYSMSNIQGMQSDGQSQIGGQAEESIIQQPAGSQQPARVGGFSMPPRGVGSFLYPPPGGAVPPTQQPNAYGSGWGDSAPPQEPRARGFSFFNQLNLGAPSQAPPTMTQTGAGNDAPAVQPIVQQPTMQSPSAPPSPAGDGQAILAQLAALLQNNQSQHHQQGGWADASILHKISKMNIPKFRGRKDAKSPYEYLKMIVNEARMANIDPFLIVKHKLPITMIDEAGMWLSFHSEFTTWDQFQVAFTEEYSAVNYIQRLKKELEIRSQGPNEPLTTYIHIITEMCRMIDVNYPEQEIIDKIMELMHPEYRQYLRGQNFYSLLMFEAYAKRVQQSFYQDKTYKLPPSLEESVEKSFCYNSRSDKSVKFGSGDKAQSTAVTLSALNPQISRERARKRYKDQRDQKDDSRHRRFELKHSRSGSRDDSGSRSGSAHSSHSRTSSAGSTSSQKYHSKKAEARGESQSPKRRSDKKENRKSKNRPATPKYEKKSKN